MSKCNLHCKIERIFPSRPFTKSNYRVIWTYEPHLLCKKEKNDTKEREEGRKEETKKGKERTYTIVKLTGEDSFQCSIFSRL